MELDPVVLRKDRSRHPATLRRLKIRLQSILDEGNYVSLDLYQLDDWANSIDTALRRCNRADDTLVKEETDEALQDEDIIAWDLFHTIVVETSICKRLATLKTVSGKIPSLDMAIYDLADKKARDPDKNYA